MSRRKKYLIAVSAVIATLVAGVAGLCLVQAAAERDMRDMQE